MDEQALTDMITVAILDQMNPPPWDEARGMAERVVTLLRRMAVIPSTPSG